MGGQGNVPRQVRRKRPLLPLHHPRPYARRGGDNGNRGRRKRPLLPPHHPRPYARRDFPPTRAMQASPPPSTPPPPLRERRGGIRTLFNVRAGMPLLPRPCRQVSAESYIPRDTWYCPAG